MPSISVSTLLNEKNNQYSFTFPDKRGGKITTYLLKFSFSIYSFPNNKV